MKQFIMKNFPLPIRIPYVKFTYLLLFGITCLLVFLLFHKSDTNILILYAKTDIPTSAIVYGNFTCGTWETFSYINASKYEQCLRELVDGSFWLVEGIRHTSQKGYLNSSSLIVEVGGNRGHDTVKFIELYDPWIISYEPLVLMGKNLSDLFMINRKIKIHPYGLGARARRLLIEPNDHGNAGTSIFRPHSKTNTSKIESVELLDIVQVIRQIRKTKTQMGLIDMISINCEGCEFEILPALILNNMTQYFRIIQFASHRGLLPESTCIYCQIEQALEKTHQTLYHYHMLWEGWVLKNTTKN